MNFGFEPLSDDTLHLLVRWIKKPHVQRWWREPATMEFVKKQYGGQIDGDDPTSVYIIHKGKNPIGMIQSYWLDDYPEHAETIKLKKSVGVDLFIGEENYIAKGYGPHILNEFIDKIVRADYPGAILVVADPEIKNVASIKAFEKAGFRKGETTSGEYGPEQLMLYEL